MKNKNKITDETAATEEEIRKGRKFSLADAVGREAAGALKGASPVPQMKQALLETEHLLENFLDDPEGSLLRTIMARMENNPPLIARHFDHPAKALQEFLTDTLASDSALAALVRDTDARWGREYGEKPHFNQAGQPPHPDDPYTPESVGTGLQMLLEALG